MAKYKYIMAGVRFELGGAAEYRALVINCRGFGNDLRFLTNEVFASEDQKRKDTLSRLGIACLAFYFESLANLIWDEGREAGEWDAAQGQEEQTWKAALAKYNSDQHLSIPIRKFLAKYKKEIGEDCLLETKAIRDLFSIRNKIIAHSRDRTVTASSKSNEVHRIGYVKYQDFPTAYGSLNNQHFDLLRQDVSEFLKEYVDSMHDVFDNKTRELFEFLDIG